ncbi:putative SnoaL-like domain-containing protein [Seiridium cardinale]|uniref:SnoaL-like domain-containing protein n=1 Tax=Seiridium cardinale TaxID=138064 RepID=A0ABR2XI36_9PEZI
MAHTAHHLHEQFEPRPDAQALASNAEGEVDYEPRPDQSIKISPEHQQIMQRIIKLYSGSASEEDMQGTYAFEANSNAPRVDVRLIMIGIVYDKDAVYDDPFSYCDTRYKIAGQWYGLPVVFSSLRTLKTEVVKDTPSEIVWKMQHEYTPKVLGMPKAVNSLISLGLDDRGKVRYHKDMWNEKDYSHEGLGKFFKTLQADVTPAMSRPPKTL